jgi:hypothetical protein
MKPQLKGYELSKDYIKLWELINEGYRIPAWVDVSVTLTHIVEVKNHENLGYLIGTRGYGYESFEQTLDNFSEICTSLNLRYISPVI